MVTRKTRLMSGLVAILMLVSMFTAFVLPVSAEPADGYTGLVDKSGLPDITTYYDGSTVTAFKVDDRAGMDVLADWVNVKGKTFSGITIYQTADIDMGDHSFAGVGYGTSGNDPDCTHNFAGTFDGNGFVFKNLYVLRMTDTGVGGVGLFGVIGSGATIKNVGIASGLIVGRNWVGSVVGTGLWSGGNIINCWNAATVYSKDGMGAGGIAGRLNGNWNVYNCYNLGLLIGRDYKMAGIAGWMNRAAAKVVNCYNAGEIISDFDGASTTYAEMPNYIPVVCTDFTLERLNNSANNYYITGRGSISSVQEYVNANGGLGAALAPNSTKVLVSTDHATGLEAAALTNGTLASSLNGTGITVGTVDGYTIAYENVTGVGYPVLTYRKSGTVVAQRTAETTVCNGNWTDEGTFINVLRNASNGQGESIIGKDYSLATAGDLFLYALTTYNENTAATVILTADIDMTTLPYLWYLPICANGAKFSGTFEGNYHTITGWRTSALYMGNQTGSGLINIVANGAKVQNVGIVDGYTWAGFAWSGGYMYGALLVNREPNAAITDGIPHVTITNCFATGTIETDNGNHNCNNNAGIFSTSWADSSGSNRIKATDCWADVDVKCLSNCNTEKARAMGRLKSADGVSEIYYVQGANDTTFKAGDNTYTKDVAVDADSTDGSLAYYLNTQTGMTHKWTVKDGLTTFAQADGSDAITCKITVNKTAGSKTLTEDVYVSAGEYPVALEGYSFDSASVTVTDGKITVGESTKEVTLNYTLTGNATDLAQKIVDELAPYDTALFTQETAMNTALENAKAALNGTASDIKAAVEAAVAAYPEDKSEWTLNYTYPNYPSFSEEELYEEFNDQNQWGIADRSDWEAFVTKTNILSANNDFNGHKFTGYTFHLLNDIDMGNEKIAPAYNHTKAMFEGTLNGHGHVFKNLFVQQNVTNVCRYVGLFGRVASSGSIYDLGIESGLIHAIGACTEETLCASIAGESWGIIRKCWNGAEVRCEETGTGAASVSGIARMADNTTLDGVYNIGKVTGSYGGQTSGLNDWSRVSNKTYNSFSLSNIYNTAGGKVQMLRQHNDYYKDTAAVLHSNNYAVGGLSYNNATKSGFNAADYELAADTYTTGELAWRLNSGYEKGTRVYYTLQNSKTVFGADDGSNATRKLTIQKKAGEAVVETIEQYVNAGTTVTIASYEHYDVANAADMNKYDSDANTFVMPSEDVTLVYSFQGESAAAAKLVTDAYDAYYEGYKAPFDLFTQQATMLKAYTAAKKIVDGEVTETADIEEQLKIAFDNFIAVDELTLKNEYPYYPKFTQFEAYKTLNVKDGNGRVNWRISDAEEWATIAQNSRTKRFEPEDYLNEMGYPYYTYNGGKADNRDANTKVNNTDGNYVWVFHFTDDIDFADYVAKNGSVSPFYADCNYTIDGHGHVLSNLKIEEDMATTVKQTFTIGTTTYSGSAAVALLGGQQWNMVLQNLGMDDTCSVVLKGVNTGSGYAMAASFYGCSGGYAASVYNCWSAATVSNRVVRGDASKRIASGLGNIRRYQSNGSSAFYNCFYAGDITSSGETYVIWHGENYGGSTSPHRNVYGVGDIALTNQSSVATSENAMILDAEAYANGELAAKLNAGYQTPFRNSQYAVAKQFYTVSEGKTCYGTEATAPRTITLKSGDTVLDTVYGVDGSTVVLNYSLGATYTVASGASELADDGKTLTVNGNTEITVALSGTDLHALQEAVAQYDGKTASYYKENEAGEALADVLAEANAILDGEKTVSAATVATLIEKLNGFTYKGYPNAPKVSEYALYPDAPDFIVDSLDELNALAENAVRFSLDQTIYITENIEVTSADAPANDMSALKASINGLNHAIKGITFDGEGVNYSSWLSVYDGSYIGNLTMDSWKGTELGWQGSLLVGACTNTNLTLENITAINCEAVNKDPGEGYNNGSAIILGINQNNCNTTLRGITIKNCTLSKPPKNSCNHGLVVGRNENGVLNLDGIYLDGNTITGTATDACGVVIGEATATINASNVAVYNTTVEGGYVDGVLAGGYKSGTLTATNVVSVNNGGLPVIYNPEDTKVPTVKNIYTDGAYIFESKNDATLSVAGNNSAAAASGEAAYVMNQASTTYTWEMAVGAAVPTFGSNVPYQVKFTLAEADYEADTELDITLYTDAAGNLIGLTDEVENTIRNAAMWDDATVNEWYGTFDGDKTYEGTPYPKHSEEHNSDRVVADAGSNTTHILICDYVDPVTGAECRYQNNTAACEFEDQCLNGNDTKPEESKHQGVCACGNTEEAIYCKDGDSWDVETVESTLDEEGSVTYTCGCGYEHVETLPKKVGLDADAKIGYIGQEMVVQVSLKNARGLAGAVIDITYDRAEMVLKSATVAATGMEADLNCAADPAEGESTIVTDCISFVGAVDHTGSDLLTLVFEIPETARETEETPLTIHVKQVTTANMEDYEIEDYAGMVQILTLIRGDFDGDRTVTIRDAIKLLRWNVEYDLIESDPALQEFFADVVMLAGDANGDSEINLADVIKVLKILCDFETA